MLRGHALESVKEPVEVRVERVDPVDAMWRLAFCRLIVFCFAKRTGVFGALFLFSLSYLRVILNMST